MERILKQNIGTSIGKSMKRNANGEIDSAELVDELQVLMKRIEFLE